MPTPSPARVHDFTVVSNEPIAQGVYALRIKAPALAAALVPGQFLNFEVPGNAMSLLRVPLSFAAVDSEKGTVDIWYAVVGEGTRRLSGMAEGETSTVLGPGGRGWTLPEAEAPRVLVVAGGIGVPPVVALAHDVATIPGASIDAVIGAASESRLVGVTALEDAGATVRVATDDGSAGYHGFCTDLVDQLLAQGSYDYIATCGPEPMMAKVAAAAEAAGVPCEASLERMMSCGFGACATCAVETKGGMKGACMCGPVFNAKEVVW